MSSTKSALTPSVAARLEHGAELGVVERPVDEGHDRGEANRLGGEIGLGRQRLEFLGAGRRQSGKVGRELELEDVARGRDDAGAIRRCDGRSRCRDRAHRLENGLRLGGSGIDMHDCAPVGSSDGADRITPPSTRSRRAPAPSDIASDRSRQARSHPDNNGQHFTRDHALARNHIPEL